jgi:acetyltransferase-like isoleucine patch superfamily enzyme
MTWLSSLLTKIGGFVRVRLLAVMSNERRIRTLREYGVRIGKDCYIAGRTSFSTEPYLVEIGDHVAISTGCQFITHDASTWLFRDTHPDLDVLGSISVGSNTYFGTNCTLLPNSRVGSNCIVGSGSVIRGAIPDGSVVFGNPAKVVMKTALMRQLLVNHKHALNTFGLSQVEKEKVLRGHFGLTPARVK